MDGFHARKRVEVGGAGEWSVQHQVRDAIRVTCRICDRRGRACRLAPHVEASEPESVDDCLNIEYERIERKIGDRALREAAPARVVPDELPIASNEPMVLPGPLALDVRERRMLQFEVRLAFAHRPVGDADAVGGGREADIGLGHHAPPGRTAYTRTASAMPLS